MSTFTEEIKNEIIKTPIGDECCKIAFLSAFLRTSGSIISVNGNYGFEIVTESEGTAEYVCDLVDSVFGLQMTVSDAKLDVLSGKDKLKFECVGDGSLQALEKLGILRE